MSERERERERVIVCERECIVCVRERLCERESERESERERERVRERVGRRREGERRRGGVVGGGRAESVFLEEG